MNAPDAGNDSWIDAALADDFDEELEMEINDERMDPALRKL